MLHGAIAGEGLRHLFAAEERAKLPEGCAWALSQFQSRSGIPWYEDGGRA